MRHLRRAWRAIAEPYAGMDALPTLQAQFEQVEAAGVRLAHWFRAISMLIACTWILARAPILSALYYITIAAVLVASSYAQSVLARSGARRHVLARYGLILFDAALITAAVLLPNPTVPYDWPIAMQLRLGNYEFLLMFLLLAGLTFSPATVLATGASLGVCWSIGMTLILMRADVFTVSLDALYTINNVDSVLELMLNRHYVSAVVWAQQIVILTILTGILAAIAVRSRRLASREVRLAYERANLFRYFSPNLARTLATAGEAIAHPKQHSAAVLFVDLVGFTRMCEQLAPDDSMTLLQSYYRRSAQAVFEHQGTLNKYIGDAVMATFGIFEQDPQPASRALACAYELLDEMRRWTEKRQAAGRSAILVGVGIHYGEVLVGDAGDDQCREFAVLGSTVNIAARVERETRRLHRALIVSDALAAAVAAESGTLPDGLDDLGRHPLRGLDDPVRLWGGPPLSPGC